MCGYVVVVKYSCIAHDFQFPNSGSLVGRHERNVIIDIAMHTS